MNKIKVLQQVLNPTGIGGVSTEFKALKNSKLATQYSFDEMILKDIHPGVNIKDIKFYYNYIRKSKPDIIHVRGAAVDGLNAVIAAKLARQGKILITVHGMYSDLVYASKLKKWVSKNIIERLIFKLSDGISCVCMNAEKRPYFDKYRDKMLPFVYNRMPTFDLKNKEIYKRKIRKQYGIPESAILGLYVGRMTLEKGLKIMTESLREISKEWPDNFFVMFVGDGDFQYNMKNECEKISNKIIFTGSQSNVEEYYLASDFFIQPSLHENHSIALLEACAAQLPSIATECGGNPEIVANNETGILIPINDSKSLTKAIYNMNNKHTREIFSENIKKHDYSCFLSECIDESLNNVYERIMNRNVR